MAVVGVSVLEPIAFAQKANAITGRGRGGQERESGRQKERQEGRKKNGERRKRTGTGTARKRGRRGWTFKAKLNRAMLLYERFARRRFIDQSGLGLGNTRRARCSFRRRRAGQQRRGSGIQVQDFPGLDGHDQDSAWMPCTHGRYGQSVRPRRERDGSRAQGRAVRARPREVRQVIVGLRDSASDGTATSISRSQTALRTPRSTTGRTFLSSYRRPRLDGAAMGRDFFAGPDVGDSGRYVKYVTPKFMGFEAADPVGQPMGVSLLPHKMAGGHRCLSRDRAGSKWISA